MTARYRVVILICFIALLLPCGHPLIFAQDSSSSVDTRYYWVDVGVGGNAAPGGLGTHAEPSGLSVGIGLYYQIGKHLFSLRYTGTISTDFSLIGTRQPSERLTEAGVLYGRAAKSSYGAASISAGISIVHDSSSNSFTTIGVPLEAQLIWTPTSLFGIGFKAFANLNPQKSFLGGLICLQIGKLK